MYSTKYRVLLKIWDFIPFKKSILNLIKKTYLGKTPKYIGDLYINSAFTTNINGTEFKLYSKRGDKSTYEIFLYGLDKGWDRFSLKIWNELAAESKVIVDVGTNIGLYCLSAKAKNKSAIVIGFEPSNKAFEVVEKNIRINKFDIILEKAALSSKIGVTTFYDLDQHTAISSLELNANLKSNNYKTYEVGIKTFDSYKQSVSLEQIDLVSIDVEEHEPDVLTGMRQILISDEPTIIIEVLHTAIGNEIQQILDQYHYHYFWINENGELIQTKNLNIEKPRGNVGYNVLAVKRNEVIRKIKHYIKNS